MVDSIASINSYIDVLFAGVNFYKLIEIKCVILLLPSLSVQV